MKSKFMRSLALGLAMATAFTTAAPNSALLAQAAAKPKLTASVKKIKAGGTVTYKVKNLKKSYYYTVKVTGAGKKLVQVKKGKTTVKSYKKTAVSKKAKVGAKTLTLKAKNKSTKTKATKYTVTVTVYKSKTGKKVATLKTTTTINKKGKAVVQEVPATGVALDKESYTVGLAQSITLFATPAPADTTDTAVWTSSDETIATVADGVVTGIKEGTVDITVTYRDGVSATAKVTVSKQAIVYNMTSAKQVAANKLELVFDNPEAKNLTQKTDVVVGRKDGTQVIAIDNFAWSQDGTTAVATLQTSLADKVDYTVAFRDVAPVEFTASVGEVASVAVLTASAQKGVETPVEVALYDANGMDVTAAISNNDTVEVNVNGNAQINNAGNWKKTAVVMDNVGDTVDVTVSYTKNGSQDPITGVGKITCIEATAVVGTGIFKSTGNINSESKCAKFYLAGMSDSNITVEEDKNKDDVYFCALDENGKAIKYDSYEVTSSADDTMTVEIDGSYETSSKFTKMTISGNKKGQAVVNVKAIKNDKETMYTIPVVVVEKAKLQSIIVKLDKSSISNAYDKDYYGKISVQAKDQRGEFLKLDSVSVELDDSSKDKASKLAKVNTGTDVTLDSSKGNFGFDIVPFNFTDGTKPQFGANYTSSISLVENAALDKEHDEYTGAYKAWGVEGATFKLKVTGSYDSEEKVSNQTISVKGLSKNAWNTGESYQEGIALKYDIELEDSTLDLAKPYTSRTVARLAAYEGSTFAGYVRGMNAGLSTSTVADITTIGAAFVGNSLDGVNDVNTGSVLAVSSDGSANILTGGATQILGSVKPKNADSYITNVKGYVSKAGRFSVIGNDAKAELYGFVKGEGAAANSTSKAAYINKFNDGQSAGVTIHAAKIGTKDLTIVPYEQKYDQDFAQTGSYTVKFEYSTLKEGFTNNGKYLYNTPQNLSYKTSKTKSLSVKNSLFVPSLAYNSKNVEGMTGSDIVNVLETNVDLNHADSMHESIQTTFYKALEMNESGDSIVPKEVEYGSTSTTVKYAIVKTNIGEDNKGNGYGDWDTITYYLPLGQTFYAE